MRSSQLAVILFCVLSSFSVQAQMNIYSFNPRSYDFDQDALVAPLMDSTGYHSCVIWSRVFNELKNDSELGNVRFRLVHDLIQLNDVSAVEQNNKFYIPVYNDHLIINAKVRVIKDGKVLYTSTDDDIKEIQEEDVKYRIVALKNVSVGCYIESIVCSAMNISFPGSEYYQMYVPIHQSLVVWITPESTHIKSKVQNGQYTPLDTLVEDRLFTILSVLNVPAMQDEQYCFKTARRGRIDFAYAVMTEDGTLKDKKWSDLGSKFYYGTFENFEKSKSGVKKAMRELKIADSYSEMEKIYVLEDYLKRNVSVGDSYETTALAAEIIQKKMTSKYGRNRFYMFAFRELNIPFEIIVTCPRDDRNFDREFCSDLFAQNVLFFFPNSNVYMDPDAPEYRIPHFSPEFYGQDAMRIKSVELGGVLSPVTVLKRIPANNLEENIFTEKFDIGFTQDNASLVISYYKAYSGITGSDMRLYAYYGKEEEVEENFEKIIKSGHTEDKVTNQKLENYNISDPDAYSKPFVTSAELSGSDLLEFAGDRIILKIGEVIGPQSELYEEKPRQNGVDIQYAHAYRRTITAHIPDGYEAVGFEGLKNEIISSGKDRKYAQFVSDYSIDGNILTVTIDESYFDLKIPFEEYGSFSNVINAAADFNKVDLILERK